MPRKIKDVATVESKPGVVRLPARERKQSRARSANGNGMGGAWWKLDADSCFDMVSSNLNFFVNNQLWRLAQIRRFARLYDNTPGAGTYWTSSREWESWLQRLPKQHTENVSKSCIDTLGGRTTKIKPRPFAVSSNGNWRAQQQCRMITQFVSGVFEETRYYEHNEKVVQDALCWGEGWKYWRWGADDKLHVERVPDDQIWINDVEAHNTGRPRELHYIRQVDKDELKAEYPDHDEIIDAAGNQDVVFPPSAMSLTETCTVRESWRLPDGKKPGVHVVTVDTGALTEMEPYARERFPFSRLTFSDTQFGWFGAGAMAELESSQERLNVLNYVIDESMDIAGTYKIWMNDDGNENPLHVDDELGTILGGKQAPEFLLPGICQPEIYAQKDKIIAYMYQMFGVSQLSAGGQVPENLKSGEAIRAKIDVDNVRFIKFIMRYERMCVDDADLVLALIREREQNGKKNSYKVRSRDRDLIEELDWKDLGYEPDLFVMDIFPISSLPDDVPGRYDKITELYEQGQIDPDTYRSLIDFPDVNTEETLFRQRRRRIMTTLDNIILKGAAGYEPPDQLDNLQLAWTMGVRYWKLAQNSKAPEDRMALLKQYLDAVQALQEEAQQQAQQQQMAAATHQAQLNATLNPAPPTLAPAPLPQAA